MTTSLPTRVATVSLGEAQCPIFFPPDMPVSYDTAGGVASRFGDLSWNLSSMSADGVSGKNLHFFGENEKSASSLTRIIREQQKALIWLHMDSGQPKAWSTLKNVNYALTNWCEIAARREVDLYALLTNPEWVAEVASELNTNYVQVTPAVLKTMWRHRHQLKASSDFQSQRIQDALRKEVRSRPATQQTPLIPSRVYCLILAMLGETVNRIEHELDLLLNIYSGGRAPSPNVAKRRAAAKRITDHQLVLMLIVAAYTGMRFGEIAILPRDDVLVDFENIGSTHYELRGATYKLHKGARRPTTWITSHQGARAVRLAQRIARAIHWKHDEPPKTGQQALLFPSANNPYKSRACSMILRSLYQLIEVAVPVIEQSDIDELDQLELARGWARDDIVVGKRWPLSFHQLRRSLAVYAHRSGMVSLPALKAQLQHITQEMSAYYADGFSRAVNLVFDREHFSHEWKAAKAESSYFAYVFGVLFSDEDMLGLGAERIARTVAARSRQDTMRLFVENKLAYSETPLGGCVSTEVCKTDPLEPIPYDCLETNCVNLVVFGKRLDHVIKFQEVAVATLERDEAGSVEHRLEARHLEVLLKARERLKKEGC